MLMLPLLVITSLEFVLNSDLEEVMLLLFWPSLDELLFWSVQAVLVFDRPLKKTLFLRAVPNLIIGDQTVGRFCSPVIE